VIGRGSVKEGVGIVKALSRRDEMKVARHEMPGIRAPRSPSRRVRHDRLFRASYRLARWTTPAAPDHTVPYGTDHICRVSRHFIPGYHRLVPPGQIQARPFVEVREQSEAPAAEPQLPNTPILRATETENSLSKEAQALWCRPLKSASQARHAPQPGRWRSRKDVDEDEYETAGKAN
jgi:hypothetical protein